MLLPEKQAAGEARKACADAEARNMDLTQKLEEAEGKVHQLQESVQRFVSINWKLEFNENYFSYPLYRREPTTHLVCVPEASFL